jgi:hypothetical protein
LEVAGSAIRLHFVVGAGCAIPRESRTPQTRCPDRRPLNNAQRGRLGADDTLTVNDVVAPGTVDFSQRCVSRPFSSWNRSILTEIYLCHACSCQEILRTETAGQGESACVGQAGRYTPIDLADPAGTRASQRKEKSLLREDAQFGDVARIDVVDEYSKSSHKMAAYLKKIATEPETRNFKFMLKLDDDNMCDVARIACGLAAMIDFAGFSNSATIKSLCQSAKLTQPPFKRPGPHFWWSWFRQYEIQSKMPDNAYFIDPSAAAKHSAHTQCIHELSIHKSVHHIKPAYPGKYFEPYGYGGSHLLEGGVIRWLARHPEALSTDIWMEDIAFGVWFSAFTRAQPEGVHNTFLVHDHHWMTDHQHQCVSGALGTNAGAGFRGDRSNGVTRVPARWNSALQECGNGCGCTGQRPIDAPITVNAHMCYTIKTERSHQAGMATGRPGKNQGVTPKYIHPGG